MRRSACGAAARSSHIVCRMVCRMVAAPTCRAAHVVQRVVREDRGHPPHEVLREAHEHWRVEAAVEVRPQVPLPLDVVEHGRARACMRHRAPARVAARPAIQGSERGTRAMRAQAVCEAHALAWEIAAGGARAARRRTKLVELVERVRREEVVDKPAAIARVPGSDRLFSAPLYTARSAAARRMQGRGSVTPAQASNKHKLRTSSGRRGAARPLFVYAADGRSDHRGSREGAARPCKTMGGATAGWVQSHGGTAGRCASARRAAGSAARRGAYCCTIAAKSRSGLSAGRVAQSCIGGLMYTGLSTKLDAQHWVQTSRSEASTLPSLRFRRTVQAHARAGQALEPRDRLLQLLIERAEEIRNLVARR